MCLLQGLGIEGVDFVHIWYSNQSQLGLMRVKYTLVLCQNVAFMSVTVEVEIMVGRKYSAIAI